MLYDISFRYTEGVGRKSLRTFQIESKNSLILEIKRKIKKSEV